MLSRLRLNLERGEMFEGEATNYHKNWNGPSSTNRTDSYASGKITHFVAIQRDITPRKQLEIASPPGGDCRIF